MAADSSNTHWKAEKKSFFLGLLIQSCQTRDQKLAGKQWLIDASLFFIDRLTAKSPSCKWDLKRIERQYNQFKNDYHEYRKALLMRGAKTVSVCRGTTVIQQVHLSALELEGLKGSYSQCEIQALRNGLIMGNNTTLESYDRLFPGCLTVDGEAPSTPGCPVTKTHSPMTDSCSLVRMPSEILLMIGSYLIHQELKACTAISKRLRDLFAGQVFNKLRFLGTLEGLTEELQILHRTLEQRSCVFNGTRHVIFQIVGLYFSVNRSDAPILDHCTANLLGNFLQRMESIHSVTFDLDLRGQSSASKKLFISDNKWAKSCNVLFDRANIGAFKTIIDNFGPESLKAVQLPLIAFRAHFSVLKTQCRSLKALHIDTKLRCGGARRDPFLPMKPDFLEYISEHFPELESLTVDESCRSGGIRSIFRAAEIDENAEALAEMLREMKGLRRFAFGLRRNQVTAYVMHQRRIEMAQPGAQFGHGAAHPSSSPVRITEDSCCADLLRKVLLKVPHLQEIRILERRRFHKSVRDRTGLDIRALPLEDGIFPGLLMG